MKDKIKLAVIGCGVWGQAHAEVFARHPHGQLVAVADQQGPRPRRSASSTVCPGTTTTAPCYSGRR